MAQCITCGTTLHPERARKYSYCMARECQEKNATGLTMVAVGMNKAADQIMVLDEQTREDLASGKFHDQRRGSFGTSAAGHVLSPEPGAPPPPVRPARRAERQASRAVPARSQERRQWTPRQERLAVIYNEQGLRPAEIAEKLGLAAYTVTQIILAARNRAKS